MNITIILLVACASISSSVYSQIKDNVISFLQRPLGNSKAMGNENVEKIQGSWDVLRMKEKSNKKRDDHVKMESESAGNQDINKYSSVDPVLNWARRSKKKSDKSIRTSEESSSSLELRDWKEEWKEQWVQKKFEAINSSFPEGDTVNMLAARPWGVSCGDPNQHEVAWGSCMLPMECEPEYRIYRGDYFCGRTQFVCCALLVSTYDMNQGFDVSFADSSLETDSEEIRNRDISSREKTNRKKRRDRNRRKRNRDKRKKEIRRNIKKIMKEIRRILNRSYRNGTTARKKKTRQLKKFIDSLKKQFKKDRMAVQSIHERELEIIDNLLERKLDQIKGVNLDFIRNHTFREIVVNGSVSPKVVRQLMEAYPDLARMMETRRSGLSKNNPRPDYLDYDIEYGLLYN